MDELRGRIDRLERQIRDLENKLWRWAENPWKYAVLLAAGI
jgi:hypothetical protein